jgi:hypothetical protein
MYIDKNEEIAWSELDEEIVLLDIEYGNYYTLNEMSALIWKLSDGRHKVSDIVGEILTLYDAEESQVRDDVLRILGDFNEKNLIELLHIPREKEESGRKKK